MQSRVSDLRAYAGPVWLEKQVIGQWYHVYIFIDHKCIIKIQLLTAYLPLILVTMEKFVKYVFVTAVATKVIILRTN